MDFETRVDRLTKAITEAVARREAKRRPKPTDGKVVGVTGYGMPIVVPASDPRPAIGET